MCKRGGGEGGWCICARGEGVREEDGAYVQEGRG